MSKIVVSIETGEDRLVGKPLRTSLPPVAAATVVEPTLLIDTKGFRT